MTLSYRTVWDVHCQWYLIITFTWFEKGGSEVCYKLLYNKVCAVTFLREVRFEVISARNRVWQRKGKSVREEIDHFLKGCSVWPFALGLVARFICHNFIWNLFIPHVSSYISSLWCYFWSDIAFTHYHLCRSWNSWLFCQAMREQTERERERERGYREEAVHSGLSFDCWLLSPISSLLHSLSLPPSLSQSAPHWEKHVQENCKGAELCECV